MADLISSKYYWPKECVERWWGEGWDWNSLNDPNRKAGQCPHPKFNTYTDYYGQTFSKTILFDDPRPDKTGQISEWDYWHLGGKGRWLTNFPKGSAHWWTPYHLPLYDPNTLELSPKHRHYKGSAPWTDDDFEAFTRGLIARILFKTNNHSVPLAGIVTPSDTDLSKINVPIYVIFSNTLWGPWSSFSGVTFSDKADFEFAAFGGNFDFSKITFCGAPNFSNATFSGVAKFKNTIFDDPPYFDNATFHGNADFTKSAFNMGCIFNNATFRGLTYFENATLKGWIDFTNTKFDRMASFRDVKFKTCAYFTSATFSRELDFTGGQFTGRTDFSHATFHGLAKFYDAELSEETYFTFKDAHWPIPPAPRGRIAKSLIKLRRYICGNHEGASEITEPEASTERFQEYEKAFCRLKKIQQGHEARTAEHFFYKLELKARMRRSDIRRTEKLAAGVYGLFSDYGESIGLPLRGLLISLGVSTAAAYFAALPFWQEFAPDNLGFAATAAWHNLVPGGFIKDVFQGCHDEACRSYRYGEWSDHLLTRYGFSLYFVTGLFAACNLALWFLFGLALKRRFQIK